MIKFRYQFVVPLVILIIFVFTALGFLLGQLFKTNYKNMFQSQIQREGELFAYHIEQQGGTAGLETDFLNNINELLNSQITILDKYGKNVYADNAAGTVYYKHQQMIDNIVSNIEKEPAGTVYIGKGFDVIYYWQSIEVDGEYDGIIILTTKFQELKESYKKIWMLLSVSLDCFYCHFT